MKNDSSAIPAHFELLDGLRGIAALTVMLGHATALIYGDTWVPRKILAVFFFFLLSGFVIACAYEDRLNTGMSSAQFYLRRAIRLYPLILVATAIGTLWLILSDPYFEGLLRIAAPIFAALCLPMPETAFSPYNFPINAPEWSLFIEMLAYVAFALLMRKASSRVLVLALAASLGAFFGLHIAGIGMGLSLVWTGALGLFLLGVLLWRHHQKGALPKIAIPFPVLSVCLAAACLIPRSAGRIPDILVIGLLFPAIIVFGAAHGRRRASAIERFIGELSYPLYILHLPVLLFARHVFERFSGHPLLILALSCGATIVVSWLALAVFDRPVRQFLTKKLVGGRPYGTIVIESVKLDAA